MSLTKHMVLEMRLERDWALICSGKFDECFDGATKDGFRVEGYVNRGILLFNPRNEVWATVTQERINDISNNSAANNWYLFEYPKRPDMDDPRRDMIRGF